MKYLLVILIFLAFTSFGQINSDPAKLFAQTNCYDEHFNDKEESVFTKIEIPAYFKGGSDAFLNFLISHINFDSIVIDLKQNERVYSDTATLSFIVSKKGRISDLTIAGTKREILRKELFKTIIQSSCYWVPGNFSGRFVNGWYKLKIFYTIDRRRQDISTKVGYDMLDY